MPAAIGAGLILQVLCNSGVKWKELTGDLVAWECGHVWLTQPNVDAVNSRTPFRVHRAVSRRTELCNDVTRLRDSIFVVRIALSKRTENRRIRRQHNSTIISFQTSTECCCHLSKTGRSVRLRFTESKLSCTEYFGGYCLTWPRGRVTAVVFCCYYHLLDIVGRAWERERQSIPYRAPAPWLRRWIDDRCHAAKLPTIRQSLLKTPVVILVKIKQKHAAIWTTAILWLA